MLVPYFELQNAHILRALVPAEESNFPPVKLGRQFRLMRALSRETDWLIDCLTKSDYALWDGDIVTIICISVIISKIYMLLTIYKPDYTCRI
jgi:hypothetical protein